MIPPEEALQEICLRATSDAYWTWKPLPNSQGQKDFIRDVKSLVVDRIEGNPRGGVYIVLGGNRSGKSESGAWAFAHYAMEGCGQIARKLKRPVPLWAISRSAEESGEIVWKQKLKKFIPPNEIKSISYRDKARDWPAFIKMDSGVEIIFKTSEQGRDAFQGQAIYAAWGDEQFPQDVMEETVTRCADHNAPIFRTLTPVDPDLYLQDRYTNPPSSWHWYEINLNDNRRTRGGYLDDAEVDRMIEEWAPEMRETRTAGKFAGFQGSVYPSFSRSLHVVEDAKDPLFKRIPQDWRRYRGVDFGFNAPFCCLWAALDPDGNWWFYDEHYESRATIEHHAAIILRKSMEHGALDRPEKIEGTFADPGGDKMPTGSTMDLFISGRRKLMELGVPVTNAYKDLHRGIEVVQEALAPRQVGDKTFTRVHISASRCPNLIRYLPAYRWPEATSDSRNPADVPIAKDNHAPDVFRYIIYSVFRQGQGGAPPRVPGAERATAIPQRRSVLPYLAGGRR